MATKQSLITSFFQPDSTSDTNEVVEETPVQIQFENQKFKRAKVDKKKQRSGLNHFSILDVIENRRLKQNISASEDQFLWKWLTARKILRRPQRLWLNPRLPSSDDFTSLPNKSVSSMEFDSSGQLLATATENEIGIFLFESYRREAKIEENSIDLYDFYQSQEECETNISLTRDGILPELTFHTPSPIESIRWNPMKRYEVAASLDRSLDVVTYDIETGTRKIYQAEKVTQIFHALNKGSTAMTFLPAQPSLIIAAGGDGTARSKLAATS